MTVARKMKKSKIVKNVMRTTLEQLVYYNANL